MTKEQEQALDMVIMDSLMEFKMGTITFQQATKEIKQAAIYYTGPEEVEDGINRNAD